MPFWDKFSKKYSGEELYQAAKCGDMNSVQKILKSGIDPNQYRRTEWNNSTTLMAAASKGHVGVVEALISAGADVNIRSSTGYTALAWAAQEGHSEVVEVLLNACGDIDSKDNYRGGTPFLRSCERGHLGTAYLLLSKGADVHARNTETGRTAIAEASINMRQDVIKFLLSYGSSVNVTDNKGFTPLHHASQQWCHHTVRLLLENGADVKAQNVEKNTPLYMCAKYGHLSTTKLLLEEGGALCTLNVEGSSQLPGAVSTAPGPKLLLPGRSTKPAAIASKPHGAGNSDVDEVSFWMEALCVVSSDENILKGNNCYNVIADRNQLSSREEDMCKICMDATIDCVLLECGHIVSCLQCGKQLSRCPVCRREVCRVMHTYKA